MKTILTLALLFILSGKSVMAQSSAFIPAIKKGLEMAKTNHTPAVLLNTANYFEQLSVSEKNQWLPLYYASFYNLLAGLQLMATPKEADKNFDKAMSLIVASNKIKPNESEILALKSQISYMLMAVDPMSRYQIYLPQSKAELDSAATLNPANPRVDFIAGQQSFYTPEQYGGGKAVARPQLQKAMVKFKTFKPETDLSPSWGLKETQTLLDSIK